MPPLAATSHTRPTTTATTCVWPSRAPVRVRCPGVCVCVWSPLACLGTASPSRCLVDPAVSVVASTVISSTGERVCIMWPCGGILSRYDSGRPPAPDARAGSARGKWRTSCRPDKQRLCTSWEGDWCALRTYYRLLSRRTFHPCVAVCPSRKKRRDDAKGRTVAFVTLFSIRNNPRARCARCCGNCLTSVDICALVG